MKLDRESYLRVFGALSAALLSALPALAQTTAIRPSPTPDSSTRTWLGMSGELQRDWARTERLGEVAEIFGENGGASGAVLAWELQLLQANEIKSALSFGADEA